MGMMVIKERVSKDDLVRMAKEGFGDMVKAVVDVRQEIMALGGELHADEEVLLAEKENSARADTWGVNIYPERSGRDMLEFDSMINLKPAYGNRTKSVEDADTQEKIRLVIKKLIK
jgi:hypothetical protein